MNAVILSCTTMLDFVRKAQEVCGTAHPVIELDRKYHAEPKDMRSCILETLKKLPDNTDTVLVAMGLCGGSWENIECPMRVVIPRVADCVAMALTTPDRYAPDLKEPGHMYLFGEGQGGFSIRDIYDSLRERYDEDLAEEIFEMYFENYHDVDVVDNGLYDCRGEEYSRKAREEARLISADLHYVKGSNVLLEGLVGGLWDERFLVLEKGTCITQKMFL